MCVRVCVCARVCVRVPSERCVYSLAARARELAESGPPNANVCSVCARALARVCLYLLYKSNVRGADDDDDVDGGGDATWYIVRARACAHTVCAYVLRSVGNLYIPVFMRFNVDS